MTQEALKLALDALEDIANETYDSWTNGAKAQRIAQGLIPTIKEALREHAMREVQRLGQEIEQEPVMSEDFIKWDEDIDPIGEVVGFIEGSPYIMVKVHKGTQVSLDDDLYAAPPQSTEQEPVGYWKEHAQGLQRDYDSLLADFQAQLEERNFCPRCGKRTKDIHTCTPPKENT